jgi:hypothetical protein
VSPEEDTNEQFITDQQPRCEIGKVLIAGDECQRPGEVQLHGSLLCVPHAELLRLEDRSASLLGTVFMMDQWLDSVDGEADELRVRRVEQQRSEVVEQLRFNRSRMDLIHDELLTEQDRTP